MKYRYFLVDLHRKRLGLVEGQLLILVESLDLQGLLVGLEVLMDLLMDLMEWRELKEWLYFVVG